ncbi:hypothetical protein CORC01_03504 [Colletotrichum orchidophilum]|uniref:Uncharacterized protein n=1 Tax=Colletotrichum orchidophilum TaxID=1209926 RepID=A0A1G4BIC0_9PEZI|nr:uncharacterized protein CORC01_03504 [Colletotrichum orchidophilum]OHF01189.1 hypothetical protein CORC01_03504 [Colletotrichum orchidophilum]
MHAPTVLILALGAFASAQKFIDFPNSLKCQTDGAGKEFANITKIDAQDAVKGPNGNVINNSAADAASGKCVKLSGVPFYAGSVPGKGSIYFAYDKAQDTYYFCSAQGAVDNKSGYPASCTEN